MNRGVVGAGFDFGRAAPQKDNLTFALQNLQVPSYCRLRYATYCSALTVQGTGAQDSMPDIQAVLDFYRKYSK